MALDLSGATVVTEAATGAYVVTPVIAALAGASSVTAVTRSTRYGTVDEVRAQTFELAEFVGVAPRIDVVERLTPDVIGSADIVTNSGHVRPIDATIVSRMRSTCVVPLMFETWEIDAGRIDVDLDALRRRGIRFAGTNERHPAVDVFSFLGSMAVKLLTDAQIAVYGSRLLLLCDNPFQAYLERGLTSAGATVVGRDAFSVDDLSAELDAVVVAMTPRDGVVVTTDDLRDLAERAPGTLLAQFWGDVERSECDRLGIRCAPAEAPGHGHMGVLPSAIGPEPIVRLQAGGLKVASVLHRAEHTWTDDDRRFLDEY